MLFQITDSTSELQDINVADLVEHKIGDLNAQTDEEWYPYINKTVCIHTWYELIHTLIYFANVLAWCHRKSTTSSHFQFHNKGISLSPAQEWSLWHTFIWYTVTCHILNILISTSVDSSESLLVIDTFHVSGTHHTTFYMLVLVRRHDEVKIQVIPITVSILHIRAPHHLTFSHRMHSSLSMCSMIANMHNVPQQASTFKTRASTLRNNRIIHWTQACRLLCECKESSWWVCRFGQQT